MTAPTEQTLFERITEAGRKYHWRLEWEILEPISEIIDQYIDERMRWTTPLPEKK